MAQISSAVASAALSLCCPLCNQFFEEPTSLPCSHTFCGACIRLSLDNDGLQCPTCTVPLWRNQLKKDYTLANIVNAFRGITGSLGTQGLSVPGQPNQQALRGTDTSMDVSSPQASRGAVPATKQGAERRAKRKEPTPEPFIPELMESTPSPRSPHYCYSTSVVQCTPEYASEGQVVPDTPERDHPQAHEVRTYDEAQSRPGEDELRDTRKGKENEGRSQDSSDLDKEIADFQSRIAQDEQRLAAVSAELGTLEKKLIARGVLPGGRGLACQAPKETVRDAGASRNDCPAMADDTTEDNLVGLRIRVWWPQDACYYTGVISAAKDGKHEVAYEDGDKEWLVLEKEMWEPED